MLSENRGLVAIMAVVVVVVIGALYFMFRTTEQKATIDRFEWSRTVHIDKYQTVREEAWSIPPGGRYVTERRKLHHTERVFSHYETRTRTTGSGSNSRVESYQEAVYRWHDVYRDWYTYDIERWVPNRVVKTGDTGRFEPEPFWGQVVLRCANIVEINCERERGREEHYLVVFEWPAGDGNVTQYRHESPSQTDWSTYDISGEYTLAFNGLGTLLNDPLRPQNK